ncbi:MAG: galactokinase [Anaerolineae bacterium]|nr:galactokinase [Anaerolineae bacterium]
MGNSIQLPLQERIARLRHEFVRTYDAKPELIVRAPGRVNLIGEHTDYNDGYVLPIAIDRSVLVAVAARTDRTVRLHAVDFDAQDAFSLEHIDHAETQKWSNYQRGVASVLLRRGFDLPGVDVAFSSDVPIASGLSSSAALEVGTAVMWQTLVGFALSRPELALLCQRAENTFVGVNCGIMDQFISALGQKNAALFIDCRTLDYKPVSLPAQIAVVVMDTAKRRGLTDSAYNTRRAECEQGVRFLQRHLPNITALRDVSVSEFERYAHELPQNVQMRCRHVVSENQRVLDFVAASDRGDTQSMGEMINASHISLRDDYAVSCAELDAMVEAAWRAPGVIGARMTGAGFGGCAVALVEKTQAEAFVAQVAPVYEQTTRLVPNLYVCQAEDGAGAVY